jgi:hypothetical protein
MKKSEKKHKSPDYCTELKRFHTYRYNESGKWRDYHILKIRNIYRRATKDLIGYRVLFLDIENEETLTRMVESTKKGMVSCKHMVQIETDPETNRSWHVQFHKLMDL